MGGLSRFDRRYLRVVHFAVEHQAKMFEEFVRRGDFARRPAPQFGQPEHERRAFYEAALLWGFHTGAIRRVLQAWRNAPGSLMQQEAAARDVLKMYRTPDGYGDILQVFRDWVIRNHLHWFSRQRHPGYLAFEEFHWIILQDAYPHSDEE